MIDIHCHILPGVDDGAQTLEDSLAMAREASKQGVDTIVATPHHRNGQFDNPRLQIFHQVQDLNEELERAGIPVKILSGQETRINGEMVEDLESEELLPLNVTSKYVFVELPSDQVPHYTKQVLYDMQMAGYKPVIVHPERNKKIVEQPDLLYQFVKNGAFAQVTAASVAGKFGKNIQKFSHQLIENNLVHLVASDAHNTKRRGFYMKEAFDEIRKKHGTGMVYQLSENAHFVINGEVVSTDIPARVKTKKILGIF
ncbi:tyrosine-protein phosphatase [Thalassobacillus hwangdonensis]|uniref:Tyrosine-protein phosphatase n=1 Tax=Thalassobacillus hwangdonensis TaxID=546108 RepID=A0ABW3L3V8_9BACI